MYVSSIVILQQCWEGWVVVLDIIAHNDGSVKALITHQMVLRLQFEKISYISTFLDKTLDHSESNVICQNLSNNQLK